MVPGTIGDPLPQRTLTTRHAPPPPCMACRAMLRATGFGFPVFMGAGFVFSKGLLPKPVGGRRPCEGWG